MDAAALGASCVIIEKESSPAGSLAQLSRWYPDDACNLCKALDADGGRSFQESCLRRSFEHPLIEVVQGTALRGSISDEGVSITVQKDPDEGKDTAEVR